MAVVHQVPHDALVFTSSTETLTNHHVRKSFARGFCNECGSHIYFRRDPPGKALVFHLGTVDPLYLWGEGWEDSNGEVPKGGFGRALASPHGGSFWIKNEVPGVTDKLALCGYECGPRYHTDISGLPEGRP